MAQERITVDPNRMRGLPSVRDTRVTVGAVFGQFAAGAGIDNLLADYPIWNVRMSLPRSSTPLRSSASWQ